ncbi:hypothetical protein CS022_13885 [Veronia nyctiphanis]|uniref:Uncharacterized protein n=1 Tax=Veronia nyctiphanis TaxID=1278244 RepID=A0A4Q0YUL7_9GAMM|nr:hypothetical protein [Veronia nyctiphanis]RXJ72721.1 hypothetical protein CS022_13885 [Veronia nyctiphanis]
MIDKVNSFLVMPRIIIIYWAGFWLLNGLDKFLFRTEMCIFTWYGKDRTEQFSNYFAQSDIPPVWISPLLNTIGIWEVLISVPLCYAAWQYKPRFTLCRDYFNLGMNLGALTFLAFSMGDIVIGDRAELLEHGTYFILVLISFWYVNQSLGEAASK